MTTRAPSPALPGVAACNRLNLPALRRAVKPFKLHWFARLKSTNDHAAVLRRRGALFAPAMVLTGRQVKGRGRGTHTWWSGAGCITVTFVLPVSDQLQPQQIPLLAGLAVRNAVAGCCDDPSVLLKWPNDLLYNGRKLAGLLCERLDGVDLIGVGLNVNTDLHVPAELAQRFISMDFIAGKAFEKTNVLAAVAKSIHQQLTRGAEHPFAAALHEYEKFHALNGRRITVVDASLPKPITGSCQGLDSMGRLLVKSRAGVQRIIAGQVQAF